MKFEIPDSLFSGGYKRRFSLLELYLAFVLVPVALWQLLRNRRRRLVDSKMIERIHLAVTEVNGCAACSWAHTQMALSEGLSNEEIAAFLDGDAAFVKPEEAKAIVFAQHYADARGYPAQTAYNAMLQEYGEAKGRVILAAAQVMLAGNMYGIPYSAFQARRRGNPYKDSTLGYEIGMQLAGALCIPVAFVHGLLRRLAGRPNLRLAALPL